MAGITGIMAFIQGMGLGASICATLGPQSVFVLRQGIHGTSAAAVALICTLCDMMLITVGVVGFGSLANHFPAFAAIAAWGGALFALAYAYSLLPSATAGGADGYATVHIALPPRRIFAGAVALSLLNPQGFLEMVALVGAMAVQFPAAERPFFALGVMVVSPFWFFGLAYCGQRLAPVFAGPGPSRILDRCTAALMLCLGGIIIWTQIAPD